MTGGPVRIHINGDTGGAVTAAEAERAAVETVREEGVTDGEISITFVSRDRIADLNRTYLNRSEPTDVIAFDLGEPGAPFGDVYVCPEVARDHAREHGVEPAEEMLRLVIHGVLHVLGHEHPEGPERAESEMFRRQERILAGLGREVR